jgi:choline dehydrogenase-like flavoprotein
MIITTADLEDPGPLQADICIIGAGAAGITLACELDGHNKKVLLLEAGGLKPDAELTDYYRGSATEPHPDPTQFRRVAFGGTTALWGGRCVPFDPIDFERRDYIPRSGWPISYEELARYYPRALEYCDAGAFDFTASSSLAKARPTLGGFEGRGVVLDDCIERYSLPTRFGSRYRERIERSQNVIALLNARCVRIVKSGGQDRIEAADFVDRAGRSRQVRAPIFVLATGGIEVPRLLMCSDNQGSGLGNRYDLLGRFYSCHFESTCGRVVPNGAAVSFDFEKTLDGVYCRRRLLLSAAAQREHRLLNTVFRLHFPPYSDATHGSAVMSLIYLVKSTLLPEYRAILQHGTADAPHSSVGRHLQNVIGGLPQLCKFSMDWVFRIRLARRKLPYTLVANSDGSFPLEFNCEQTPLESNRVTLTGDTDRHGLRRVHVAWRICDDDAQAAQRGFVVLRDAMNRSGTCRLEYDEPSLEAQIRRSVPVGGHHTGTARMAGSERDGVVDASCAVFGLPNLYVCSAAVFPTSSYANPTLTIVATAVRLAAHLKAATARSWVQAA